jgi:hypothetical protein
VGRERIDRIDLEETRELHRDRGRECARAQPFHTATITNNRFSR